MANKYRRIAAKIYRKFPFFELSIQEFYHTCLCLQKFGAGIVLGYPKKIFRVMIIENETRNSSGKKIVYKNLPTGFFGEIVFLKKNSDNFIHTRLYGFFDQLGRVWCCGSITNTAVFEGKTFFPYCIEPVFERIWWVKHAILKFSTDCQQIQIDLVPHSFLYFFIKLFEFHFLKQISRFAKKFAITSKIKIFRIKNSSQIKNVD